MNHICGRTEECKNFLCGDGIFEVFYLEDAVCTKYSFTADPVVIEE